jgi:hypothetical protein
VKKVEKKPKKRAQIGPRNAKINDYNVEMYSARSVISASDSIPA